MSKTTKAAKAGHTIPTSDDATEAAKEERAIALRDAARRLRVSTFAVDDETAAAIALLVEHHDPQTEESAA